MNSKKLLSFIFVMLMVAGGFAMLPVAHADTATATYEFRVFDSQGRMLNGSNYNIQQFAKLVIYKPSWLGGFFKQKLAEIDGASLGHNVGVELPANLGYADVAFYWRGQKDFEQTISLVHEQKDKNGFWIIPVNLPFTPAVPIVCFNVESIKVSADLHEIKTAYYDVKFGTGDYQSHIKLTIGTNTYDMPVKLNFQSGSNSDTKPFRFLAQSTNGYVKGTEKWLIWTTAEYWSSVRTQEVGDNMLLVVWTYGYTDVASAWIDKVIGAAVAGAIVGAATGIGAITLGAGAGIATSILWAVKPDLVNLSAHTGIGIVAGLFTPRYMIIQGVSGLGANQTTATISISNIPQSTHGGNGNIEYEIYSAENEIQIGISKNYGDIKDIYQDFEDGKTYGWSNASISSNALDGAYSIGGTTDKNVEYTIPYNFRIGDQYMITINMLYSGDTGVSFDLKKPDGNILVQPGTQKYTGPEISVSLFCTPSTNELKLGFVFATSSSSYYWKADDILIEIRDTATYRYIFETDGVHDSQIVRHIFGTIPTINPSAQGVPLHPKYTLLAIDMANKHGMLALDWESRIPIDISPARIMIRSDVWSETAWLLGTNDKDGFENVSFVIVPTWKFVYHTPIQSYYYFTSPENWTWQPGWTPFIANGTMVYVPKDIGIPAWQIWNWQINKWWENIGTWGHLALMGLAGLIILILILILAPWLIFAIVEILGLIIRGLAKAVGMAAKGAGELMKRRRRR